MHTLKELLYNVKVETVGADTNRKISKLCFDSRSVIPGSLFVALKGLLADGHDYVEEAIRKGAIAIAVETLPELINQSISYIRSEDTHELLGKLAANYYDHPSKKLQLIGITGTNGKTTCATLLYKLFRELGYHCGLISTIEHKIDDKKTIPSTHTTPDAIALNELLCEMLQKGCDYVFMEVSSQGLAQKRTTGLHFSGGLFTNLTYDHLDYHKTFDAYLKAKKSFFDALTDSAFALINADDKHGNILAENTAAKKKSYSIQGLADFKAKILKQNFNSMRMEIEDKQEVCLKLTGRFNAYNALAVYGVAILLEQSSEKVLHILPNLTGANGRFDCILLENGVIGIIDYAHTPDAVKNVLNTIRLIRKTNQQLITVIGCGGNRDASKRASMGKIAAALSDALILTADNPRSEEPKDIIANMYQGIQAIDEHKTQDFPDRKEAIEAACQLAKSGDIIVIMGKGHENYQEIKGKRRVFDDKKVLETCCKHLS